MRRPAEEGNGDGTGLHGPGEPEGHRPIWRRETEGRLALAAYPSVGEAPNAAGHRQLRDVIAPLVDTTAAHFGAARGRAEPWDALGIRDLAKHVDAGPRLVLTADSRANAGSYRGDRKIFDRFALLYLHVY